MTEQSSSPVVMTTQEQEVERRSRLLRILARSAVVICLIFLAIMLAPPLARIVPIVIFALLLLMCLVSLGMNRAGRFQPAALVYLFSLTLAIFGVILEEVLLHERLDFEIYYFPLTVLAAGMLLGPRATFGFATLSAALIVAISVTAGFVIGPSNYVSLFRRVLTTVIPPTILCYVMAVVAWLYGRSLEGALQQLTEQSQQLQVANEEIRAFSRTLEDKVEERTQELREFVSMVAHDLRGPLTTISGYAEILQELQENEPPNARRRRGLDAIANNVRHMIYLTDDLLEISRLRSGGIRFHMEPLPLEHLIEEVCEGFEQRLAEKRLGLKLELPPELPPVWGDHFRLTQVLSNLVGNACSYTSSGAIIVGARPVDGSVEVSISDTGIGIPPEEQKRLFTHFFRGEHELVRQQKGTGLGLSIVQSIIETHGGEIWVESEVDKGSTFRFTLPVAADQTPEQVVAAVYPPADF